LEVFRPPVVPDFHFRRVFIMPFKKEETFFAFSPAARQFTDAFITALTAKGDLASVSLTKEGNQDFPRCSKGYFVGIGAGFLKSDETGHFSLRYQGIKIRVLSGVIFSAVGGTCFYDRRLDGVKLNDVVSGIVDSIADFNKNVRRLENPADR